jgi:CubicO group peptidase (beta-lactamase class C family)
MGILLAALLPAGTATGAPARGDRIAETLEPGIAALFGLGFAPGMAVAAVKDGEVVFARGFGYQDVTTRRAVDPQTSFYIASTTKSLLAPTAALLAQRGAIDLDAPIARYLPGLKLHDGIDPGRVTLRALLTHTHGISNDGPVTFRTAFSGEFTNDLLLRVLSAHPPAEGGNDFQYGNIGYNVAGLVLEAATGLGWKELVEREILRPAGMNSTTAYISRVPGERLAMPHWPDSAGFHRIYQAKRDSNMHAAGGHESTVLDLARWLEANLDHGRIDGRQVFPAEVIDGTHRIQARQDRAFGPFQRYGWGFGWDLCTYEGDTLLTRFGSFYGAYRSHLSFMPHRGLGVVVLVNNGATGSTLADLVACYIYDRLLGRPGFDEKWSKVLADGPGQLASMRKRIAEDKARRGARPQNLSHPLDAYAGEFESPDFGRMQWRVVKGKLEVTMGALWSAAEVFDNTKEQIRVELTGGGEVVSFEFEGPKAVAVTYQGARFARI